MKTFDTWLIRQDGSIDAMLGKEKSHLYMWDKNFREFVEGTLSSYLMLHPTIKCARIRVHKSALASFFPSGDAHRN